MKTRLLIIIGIIVISAVLIIPNFSLEETPSSILLCNEWVFTDTRICKPLWSESDIVPVDERIKLQIWCAKKFDESLGSWEKSLQDDYGGDLQPILEPLTTRFLLMEHEHFAEWRDGGCVGIINDWAYLSENEDYIWNSGIDWELETDEPLLLDREEFTGEQICGVGNALVDGVCRPK